MVFNPGDEHGYFKASYDIVNGKFDGPWTYTVGLSLFYIPLILLSNGSTYFDICSQMTFINAFILSPASLVLVFIIIGKMTMSFRKAFFTALILAVLPFFYLYAELFAFDNSGNDVFKSVFGLPELNAASYRLYYIFISTGYNGMSDTPSMFLVFLCLYLAISRSFCRKLILAISFLFGIACLVRINNILFSPLIAYLLWCSFKEKSLSLRELVISVFMAMSAFLLVFSPQLLINKLQLGSFTTFPYIFHDSRVYKVFTLASLPYGIIYLIGCNYVCFVFCTVGLFFIKNFKTKMILVLWAIPVSIFFSGYPVIWASPVRFIMPAYAAIIASFVCMDLWGEASGKKKYLLLFAISITVLLVSPCFRLECPYPFGMENYKFGMAANLILNICMPVLLFSLSFVYMKTNYRIFLFLMLFLVLFYSGSPYLLFIMLLFHLAVSVTHWVVDVKHTLFIPAEAG